MWSRVLVATVLGAAMWMGEAGQVHVALGKTEDSLTVAWASKEKGSTSMVYYGESAGNLTMSREGDVRGFYVDLGRVWHTRTAEMTGLKKGVRYYYKVGDKTNGFSEVFSVVNRREAGPYRHILFGDMGAAAAFTICKFCTQHDKVCDAGRCAKNRTVGLVSEVETADMFLHAGDFAYNLGSDLGKTGDQFMENIEQLAAYVPYMVSHGNHEDAPESLAHYVERFRSQPTNAEPKHYVTLNGVAPNTMYFSWDFGLVHYVSFSTELWHGLELEEWGVTRKTFLAWLKDDLKRANANRERAPWILVHGHRPLYSSADSGYDHEVRKDLEPLFFEYGVDFSVNGHQHNYERSWPTYQDKSDQSYVDPNATIYVVTGAAGSHEMHTPFTKDMPSWSAFRSNTFGYTRMIVHNATHIHWQQVQTDPSDFPQADYGRVIDDLWIVQRRHGPFDPASAPRSAPASCPPTLCRSVDHFAPLLGLDDGSGRPTHQLIAEFRRTHGEEAWARKLDSILTYMNRNANSTVEWEDGLLDANERRAFRWIHSNDQ